MKLTISKSKNAESYYVAKCFYNDGKRTSRIVEKLGTRAELEKKLNGRDPVEWAKEYVAKLTEEDENKRREVMVKYSPVQTIRKNQQRTFNGGYLFLQKIYHELELDKICKTIRKKYKFEFDLNSILSRLIYGRIIFPSSKLSTFEQSRKLIEPPLFEIQHIYRALEVMAKETDFIQAQLYQNSLKHYKRQTGIVYYDVTNYFFEIEQADGLKQYGYSKEHRPNPIVQMGLFMDADGIPLAFSIIKGNTNEQITLKPLEKKLLSDFKLSKIVVCTDAGLASYDNRKFNKKGGRAFITTQSIKTLKAHIKKWALDPTGWRLSGDLKTYDITELDEEKDKEKVFYKEEWINENDLEQRLIVTFSIKYRNYQRKIRAAQIERAQKLVDTKPEKVEKATQNDYKRLIKKTHCTKDGEVADNDVYSIDTKIIAAEEVYDGYYSVCTNLIDPVADIVKVNQRRWEIEECFRVMKSEFKARPVFLRNDDRIEAHFITCFIALMIYRFLEVKLKNKFTCHEIIHGLRDMNFLEIKGEGYIPEYTRTDFTDALHDAYGFRTDYQIVNTATMKNIFKITKA